MQVHYEVKWKGFERTQNTWEPIGHLVGAEALIKELEVRLEKENGGIHALGHFFALKDMEMLEPCYLSRAQQRFTIIMGVVEDRGKDERSRILALAIGAASEFREEWQKLERENSRLREHLMALQGERGQGPCSESRSPTRSNACSTRICEL